tara:strand:+ start:262 stop:441 length:180 start_codon:yes stop_codon:yes gene_type:complete
MNETIEVSIDLPLLTPVDSDERSIDTIFGDINSDSEDSDANPIIIQSNSGPGAVTPLLR